MDYLALSFRLIALSGTIDPNEQPLKHQVSSVIQ